MTDAFSHAKSIVAKLVRAGYTAYFAGGWVRDYVMGHPSEDIDIATDAPPTAIMDLFPHTMLVGLAFGVVIVVIEGHQYEVATFRKDLGYTDGRHPLGIEMSTPFEDAMRRDFTINGMFYDPLEEVIHDFVHGQEDIRLGVVRTIGNPHERFFEDRLRMLRAFRFSSRFCFTIDPETQDAIRENADKLFPAVAMERVWQEFLKMAAYPRFDQAIVEMHRLTLLDVIFPEIAGMHIKELRKWVKSYAYFPPGCPAILYLMEFMTPLTFEMRMDIAKRLKVTRRDLKLVEYVEHLNQAVEQEKKSEEFDRYGWAKLLSFPDWELGIKVIAGRHSENGTEAFFQTYLQRHAQLMPHVERLQTGKPLVSASYLEQRSIRPGKRMGLLLKEAERIAVDSDLNDPDAVFAELIKTPLWRLDEST